MAPIPWGKFPTVAEHQLARRWLQFTANIGRAPNTIDAYGRAVEDHLRFCAAEGTDPLLARADTVAAWIRNMLDRPSRSPSKAPPRTETGLAKRDHPTTPGRCPVLLRVLGGGRPARAELGPPRAGRPWRPQTPPGPRTAYRAGSLDPQRGCLATDPGYMRCGIAAQSADGHTRLRRCSAPRRARPARRRGLRARAPSDPSAGGDHQVPKGPGSGLRHYLVAAVRGLSPRTSHTLRPHRRTAVPVDVKPQLRRPAGRFQLVEDRRKHRSTCRGRPSVHAHLPASTAGGKE